MSWLDSIFGRGKRALDTPILDRNTIVDAYKACIWPVLEAHGFTTFEGSAAWRYREKIIDVVDIMFFPIGKTRQWGLDPHCFALSGGIFYPFVPYIGPAIPVENGKLLPPEIACTDRLTPNRRLEQPHKYTNIWDIAADGRNLEAVFSDVNTVLLDELLPHLDAQGDLRKQLCKLIELKRTLKRFNPGGYYDLGFFALELGDWELARENLSQALATGFFGGSSKLPIATPTDDKIREAIQKAEAMLSGKASA